MEKLDPLPLPHIKDGKVTHFGFRAASSLIFFGGRGEERGGLVNGGLLIHYSVQDCSFETAVPCVVIKQLSPDFIK